MNATAFPFGPIPLDPLAQIIERARTDNGGPIEISRDRLRADLEIIYREFLATGDAAGDDQPTVWEMVVEESPTPTRRYKVFAKALAADDPLATLITLSHGRSPSEFFLLQHRIKSFARSQRPNAEKALPKLQNANWSTLNPEQQTTIRQHMVHLENYYYSTQKRNTDPIESRINLVVHDLADLFACHTHFDSMPSDLPYAATSRFTQFLCLALRPICNPNKLSPNAVSKRWLRLSGRSYNQ